MTHARWRAAGATAAVVLVLAGCGSSGDDDSQEGTRRPSATETTAPAEPSPAVRISKDWQARIDELPTNAATAACQDPGSYSCGELLRQIREGITGLGDDIDDAGGDDAYPKTSARLSEILESYAVYGVDGCAGDPAAGADGSECFQAALDVAVGVLELPMTMVTDEHS